MYKFEISADSPQELREKMLDFAKDLRIETQAVERKRESEYIDEDPDDEGFTKPFVPPFTVPPPYFGPATTLETPPPPPASFQVAVHPSPVPLAPAVKSSDVDTKGMPYDERIHTKTRSLKKDGSWCYKRGIDDALVAQVEAELRGVNPSFAQFAQTMTAQAPTSRTATETLAASEAQAKAFGLPAAKWKPADKLTAADVANTVMQDVPFIPPPPSTTVDLPKFPNSSPQPGAAPNQFLPLTAVVNPAAVPSQPAPQQYETLNVPKEVRPAHSYATFKANLPLVFAQFINEGKIDQPYVEELKAYFGIKEIWNILKDEAKCLELFNSFVQVGLITKVD